MSKYDALAKLSPFPIVNLNKVSLPFDGLWADVPSVCTKLYFRDETCRRHYESLSTASMSQALKQCPHGFSSVPFEINSNRLAFTGLIPFPRLGGDQERKIAKSNPLSKIDSAKLYEAIEALKSIIANIDSMENSMVKNQAMALHEIRKLNRTIKQTAERMCTSNNPADPDLADTQLVQIWKTSEIMSQQFDIIEILAGRTLTELPVDKIIEIHKILLKCVKIYDPFKAGIFKINCLNTYHPRILACNKTFPIIFTVLIENAIKYNSDGSPIHIKIVADGSFCNVSVSNVSDYTPIDDNIFTRGARGKTDKDGSGNGLYVAQLVARQHSTRITIETMSMPKNKMICTFKLRFKVV